MTELALENVTKSKCAVCGDALTFDEIESGTYCLLCEIEFSDC
jgi:hypothetical protein